MVQPAREECIKRLREHQLTVDGHQCPESNAHIQSDRVGKSREDVVFQSANGWQLLDGHFVGTEQVVEDAYGVVEGLNDLQI
jgi:hypothetical protein